MRPDQRQCDTTGAACLWGEPMRSRPVGFVAVIFAACLSAACGDTPTGPTAPTPPATESQGSRDPGTAHPPTDPADRPTTPVPPPPAPDRSSCDERNVEWAIGQPATSELLERARVAAGAEKRTLPAAERADHLGVPRRSPEPRSGPAEHRPDGQLWLTPPLLPARCSARAALIPRPLPNELLLHPFR